MCEPCKFVEFLSEHSKRFEFRWVKTEGGEFHPGIPFKHDLAVLNKDVGILNNGDGLPTETLFTVDAIRHGDLSTLLVHTHHGRNLEHMTRVTGYFSKVSGWNKGKRGELNDRSRNNGIGNTGS